MEHALIAALPLGPQSAAGGVSLPDSFIVRASPAAFVVLCARCSRASAAPSMNHVATVVHVQAATPCINLRSRHVSRGLLVQPVLFRSQGCHHVCPQGELSVMLVEARDLPVWGFPWTSNPYCRVTLGSQAERSRRDDDTSHPGRHRAPVWNQEFQFLVRADGSRTGAVPSRHAGEGCNDVPRQGCMARIAIPLFLCAGWHSVFQDACRIMGSTCDHGLVPQRLVRGVANQIPNHPHLPAHRGMVQ